MDEQFKRETEEAIAKALAEQPYIPMALMGDEIALATLRVLSRRFGAAFAEEVRQEIVNRADRLEVSDDPEDRADSAEVRAIAEASFWEHIAVTPEDA